MGVDYSAFSCIGYEVLDTSISEKIEDSTDAYDLDDMEGFLQDKYGEDLRLIGAGNHYDGDLKTFIYFEDMFVDGIYQLSKQKQLRQVVESEKIETVGFFGPHEEQSIS